MKIRTWTVALAVLALATAPARAEQRTYDQMVIPVGCESGNCCEDDCCGDPCCGDPCCGDEVGAVGLFSGIGGGALESFTIAGALGIENLEVGGWTEMGWTDDAIPLSPQGSSGSGLSFRDVPNRFNLDQQWFYLGKTADGSNGIGFGGRFDILYGVDASKTQSFGNPPGPNGDGTFDFNTEWDHGVYGWAIPQLYGEVAVGDFSAKVGHFFTPVGYEVIPATGNFFYSHALTMFNSEPFTHTGVLSTYTGFESLTLYNGWTLGWDTGFDQINSGSMYLGGVGINVSDAITFTYICCYGNFGWNTAVGEGDYSHSFVLVADLTDNLQYVGQSDFKNIDESDDEDVGLNQYLFYGLNDWCKLGTRVEWWRDDQVSHYEATGGVNVNLLGNLVIRPEVRQDWVPATDESYENMACDMILTY